jgi:uncharacterized repeat protein (TIGR01451 family)
VKDPPVPVVSLCVRVPASVPADEEIEYHICVENKSAAAAYRVLVRNALPANARFVRATPEPSYRDPELAWKLGTLEAGACKEITLVLAPTGGGEIKNCARVQFEHGECVRTRIDRAALQLRKTGPAQALRYDVLSYKLEVTNTGSKPISGVTLNDILPEGLQHQQDGKEDGKVNLSWDLGTLAPGQCRCIEYQAIAMVAGELRNRAEVKAGDLVERAESCVCVTEPQLSLEKTGPKECYANQQAIYKITATNAGTAPVTNLTITDLVPEKAAFVRASDGGQLAGKQVKWSIASLPAGGSRTVEVVLRCQGAGRVCNQATAAADRGLKAHSAEVCTDFLGASALRLDIDPEPIIEVGSEGRYRIHVQNTGSEPAEDVRIKVLLPEQLDLTWAKGRMPYSQEAGRAVMFEGVTLPPRGEEIYEVRAKANRAADAIFRVELTAKQLTAGPVISQQHTTLHDDHRAPAPPPQPPAPGTPPSSGT